MVTQTWALYFETLGKAKLLRMSGWSSGETKMPIAVKCMLLASIDIDEAHEAEFNRWYDREHLEERVAIEGFLEARRYVAHQGAPKYLSLYSTETFEVLDSAIYRPSLAHHLCGSRANIARFKNMIV